MEPRNAKPEHLLCHFQAYEDRPGGFRVQGSGFRVQGLGFRV